MPNKYRQQKVIGMLRKLAKQDKSLIVALEAVKMLMSIEGLGEHVLGRRYLAANNGGIAQANQGNPPADAAEPTEPMITAEMLRDLLNEERGKIDAVFADSAQQNPEIPDSPTAAV